MGETRSVIVTAVTSHPMAANVYVTAGAHCFGCNWHGSSTGTVAVRALQAGIFWGSVWFLARELTGLC